MDIDDREAATPKTTSGVGAPIGAVLQDSAPGSEAAPVPLRYQSTGIIRVQQNVDPEAAGELAIIHVAGRGGLIQTPARGRYQPICDGNANPAGAGDDAYSVQAWILLEQPTDSLPPEQAIFTNHPIEHPSGMALYLKYDAAVGHYRLASARGDLRSANSTLVSAGTLPFGEWVNVATSYQPETTTLSLYMNGALDSSSPGFPSLPPFATPYLLIACACTLTGGITWRLRGYLQTVDVWKVALTHRQVLHWLMN